MLSILTVSEYLPVSFDPIHYPSDATMNCVNDTKDFTSQWIMENANNECLEVKNVFFPKPLEQNKVLTSIVPKTNGIDHQCMLWPIKIQFLSYERKMVHQQDNVWCLSDDPIRETKKKMKWNLWIYIKVFFKTLKGLWLKLFEYTSFIDYAININMHAHTDKKSYMLIKMKSVQICLKQKRKL